jgi:8-oxo-dGTP pyrophosphatase MutT (NUDIX family)
MPAIFISYCQDEKDWLHDRFLKFLKPVFDANSHTVWSDQAIQPGDEWLTKITEAIEAADLALLLVSSGFLASEFIMSKELPAVLARRARGMKVLWIPVSRAVWQATPLRDLQAALNPETFLDELTPPQQRMALHKIGQRIEEALRTVPAAAPAPPRPNPAETEPNDRNGSPPVSHEKLEVTYRHDREIRGGDDLLSSASDARFIALTYKTLGLALTQGGLALPEIVHVEVAVYALPILKNWHPTLRNEKSFLLEREWLVGVSNVLTKLTSKGVAPKLETLDLRILNRVPTFTSSLLTTNSSDGDLLRIRFTPVIEDVEPSSTPTINVVLYTGEKAKTEPLFDAYARILDNMRSRSRPLVFPVMRGGHAGYVRPALDDFVDKLSRTTNDSRYGLADAEFEVSAEIDVRLAHQFRLMSGKRGTEAPVHPDSIYSIFDELRSLGKSSCFKVSFDVQEHRALIRAGAESTTEWVTIRVANPHKVGVFGILTKETPHGRAAILKLKRKPDWAYDVPGGKVADTDKSIKATISRELFEELGLEIRTDVLKKVYEYKYDPRGALTQGPVIAVYYHYKLNRSEATYLEQSLPNATDGFPLEEIPLKFLISEKRNRSPHNRNVPIDKKDGGAEALCHAPLEVFLRIQQEHAAATAG